MVIDLIFQSLFTDLVEAVKLIEIHGITVRHNHAVENDGQAALLPETRATDCRDAHYPLNLSIFCGIFGNSAEIFSKPATISSHTLGMLVLKAFLS